MTTAGQRVDGRPAGIGAEEQAVDAVAAGAERLRSSGRAAVGVTGTTEAVGTLRETLATTGLGLYPAFALGLLVAVDQLQTSALTILSPEITATLGIPRGTYVLILVLKVLTVSMVALPVAALVQHRPRRAALCIITAFTWAALTAMTGFVVSSWGLLAIAVAAGAATASVRTVQEPLLLDSYPPSIRVRILSFYRAFNSAGDVVGPLIIGLCTAVLLLTWRGAFVALGGVALVAAISALRLRDPGFGRWDSDKVREVVRADTGASPLEEHVRLGFFEVVRRVMLVPTVRSILVASAVLGLLLAPLLTYLAFFLQERWGFGPGARSLFAATMPLFGIAGLRLFGRRGEALFRRDPARLLRLASGLLMVGILFLVASILAPVFVLMALFWGISTGCWTAYAAGIAMSMFAVVPAHMRAHVGALQGLFMAGIGGVAGLALLSGFDRRFGVSGAMLALTVPCFFSGFVVRRAARTVNADLDRMIDEIVEEEECRELAARGVRLPLLSCRRLDFSYGQIQVLYGVDFTVDDGEMVALLGTNGAGKSTLLKCISGIGLPSGGSVRYRGGDITYLDAERRFRLGISQISGGHAVFGPMTVVENLRLYGYTMGRDRRSVDAAIDRCFDVFPGLAERRNQHASTLSGGEQQMLGLSKALVLPPKVLLIDELSLGLAPVVVGKLLDMVREINATGTAVVLVEQSVNVALRLVDHAYFMEKGEMRFDGRSEDLAGRSDLLRAVFLEGAVQGRATL